MRFNSAKPLFVARTPWLKLGPVSTGIHRKMDENVLILLLQLLLLAACCLLLAACCLLHAACCLLLAACCSLLLVPLLLHAAHAKAYTLSGLHHVGSVRPYGSMQGPKLIGWDAMPI